MSYLTNLRSMTGCMSYLTHLRSMTGCMSYLTHLGSMLGRRRKTFVDINDFESLGYLIRQPNRFSTVAAREGGGEVMKRRSDQ